MKKHVSLQKLLAAALSLALLCGCAGPAGVPEERAVVPVMAERKAAAAPSPTAIIRSDGIHADTDYADMSWERYDMTDLRAMAEELMTSGGGEALELYRRMEREYVLLRTWDELAWIDFYASDDPDGSIGEGCGALDAALTEAGDLLQSAAAAALAGDDPDELAGYLGEDRSEMLAGYQAMSDREAELWDRETELVLEYNDLSGAEDLDELTLNGRLGKVFLELVEVRNQLAELGGYDSYAEYAYELIYGRDYTPADAAALCEAVKPYARRYYARCYYSGVFWEELPEFSPGEVMDLLRTWAPMVSPQAAEAQTYMEEHGLYILESGETVTPVGFTATLPLYNAPFLFNALSGTIYDVTDTFHEFGHYYDAYVNQEPDPLLSAGSYDIFEIHSTSMEALLYGWLDEICGDAAPCARAWSLDRLIGNVVSGCIYDEFLQYVYSHPDMTVTEVDQAFASIARSYGMELYDASEQYQWMYVSHNFESPFYYISYAVSTLASLQIWAMAERDRDGAIALYNRMIGLGAFDLGYCQLMETLGLTLFTDDLDACLRDACGELEELCRAYDEGSLAA